MVAREEIWRDVRGGEGRYQVSNMGRVRSLPRMVQRSSSAPYWMEGSVMAPYVKNNGYLSIALKKIGKRYIHRLVADAFIGSIEGLEVDHIDGIRTNNALSNLRIVTSKENKLAKRERYPTCIRGHEYRDIDHRNDGRLDCRRCSEIRRLARKAGL